MYPWQQTDNALNLLAQWQQQGLVSSLDIALAKLMVAQDEPNLDNGTFAILVALLSYQVTRGHVCLPLAAMLDAPAATLGLDRAMANDSASISPAQILSQLTMADVETLLARHPAVLCLQPRDNSAMAKPVVYSQGALYLSRFWRYEQRISANLRSRMHTGALEVIPAAQLAGLLDELFDSTNGAEASRSPMSQVPWQKLACANTLRSRFSVITGGPGTGKTYTVVRLLAMLQRLAGLEQQSRLTIRLAAPTGKAAARLKSSLQSALAELKEAPELTAWRSVFEHLESDSETIHKLLGTQQRSRRFRHHAAKPLNLDVLVVDEASMVDIELMDALLDALPKHAKLILLGDKDQLASVEAGAILGQLCKGAEQGHYQPHTFEYLQAVSPVPLPSSLFDATGPDYLQHVVMLRVSRRFDEQSGIGHLARAINEGDEERVTALFKHTQPASQYPDVNLITSSGSTQAGEEPGTHGDLWQQLQQLCREGFRGYWQAIQQRPAASAPGSEIHEWALKVLDAYAKFQLLAALREGPFGVHSLNTEVASWLDYIPKPGAWYEGRPVMVTENDYSLNLRNGDVGMTLRSPVDDALRVVFIDTHGHLRWILPSRLRHVQTVFAMTVHKSQGSEFSHTVVVMPPHSSPILSRELIYTAVTRASKQLTMVLPAWQVLLDAVNRPTVRAGHLDIS